MNTGSEAVSSGYSVSLTFDHATRSAAIYVNYERRGGGVTTGPLVYDDSVLVFGRGLDGWLEKRKGKVV